MTEQLVRRFVRDCDKVQDPAVRERYGLLSGVVGIVLNLLLSAGKFFAGVLTGSISITADAFNNLSDAGSSVVTLVGFRLAGRKADDDHPFGHGRMEYLAGLMVSLLILLVGVELFRPLWERSSIRSQWDFQWYRRPFLGPLHRREAVDVVLSTGTFPAGSGRLPWLPPPWTLSPTRWPPSAVLLGAAAGAISGLPLDGWVGILVALFILRAGWGAAKEPLIPCWDRIRTRNWSGALRRRCWRTPRWWGCTI